MTETDREHATQVVGYPATTAELAIEVGRLRYDALALFLEELSRELARQADGDLSRGRTQLAARLTTLAADVAQSAVQTREIWRLCRRHIPQELARTPEINNDNDGR